MSLICVRFLLFPALKTRTSEHTHIHSALWLLFTVHNLQQSWLSTICNQLISYLKLNFEAVITSLLNVKKSKRADSPKVFCSVTIYVGPWTRVQLTKVSWQLVITEVGPWLAFPKGIEGIWNLLGKESLGSCMPLKPSNPDTAQDKNSSFCHPVEDKRPYFMTLTCFIHTKLGNYSN